LEKLRNNIGGLVSMNSFLSTTNDREAAIFFAGGGILGNPETHVSVLYEMTIDTSIQSVPYAKIDYTSIFSDEDEVLFSMASVFKIGEIEMVRERMWNIKLTLTDKEDEHWNKLTAHLN
ncbi:unnamed protein product, partial [Didymodactylos carnosus]